MGKQDEAAPALEVRNAKKAFGALQAVMGCSISLPPGRSRGGRPNGSGKRPPSKAFLGLERFDPARCSCTGHPSTISSPTAARG